jgi:hypothetical protein
VRLTLPWEFSVFTHMEEMQINLNNTFEMVCHPEDVCVEFPVCEGHETGKNWRYTYFTCNKEKEKNGYMRSLAKFDRVEKSWTIKEVGGNAYVNEPPSSELGKTFTDEHCQPKPEKLRGDLQQQRPEPRLPRVHPCRLPRQMGR